MATVMELIDTDMDNTPLEVDLVQFFLDNIGGNPFTVVFLKKDGTERTMTGMLDPKNKRSENVPVMDLESGQWKSCNINRVVWLEKL